MSSVTDGRTQVQHGWTAALLKVLNQSDVLSRFEQEDKSKEAMTTTWMTKDLHCADEEMVVVGRVNGQVAEVSLLREPVG